MVSGCGDDWIIIECDSCHNEEIRIVFHRGMDRRDEFETACRLEGWQWLVPYPKVVEEHYCKKCVKNGFAERAKRIRDIHIWGAIRARHAIWQSLAAFNASCQLREWTIWDMAEELEAIAKFQKKYEELSAEYANKITEGESLQ